VAGLASHAEHHLAIDEVLGTAEAEKTDFHLLRAQGSGLKAQGRARDLNRPAKLSKLLPEP
jgi:hypothetical protein